MQKILLSALFLLAYTFLPAQTQSTTSVFFELDKSELSPEARQTLDTLATRLLELPDYSANIEAYTDDRGTETYNLRLATDRANAVQQYLSKKGLLLGKTSVRSWGERNLAYDNETEENRQKNRRVDVAITAFLFSNFAEFQSHLSANTEQRLTIQPDRDQQVTAAQGTVIVVPANSFIFDDGTSPTGQVELVVREAFSASDFVLQNLTTTSDGRVLQTGGMVYINAQADGKSLTMADGAALTVALPTGKVESGMELFYGQQNSDNSVNWRPVGQTFRQTMKRPRTEELDIDPALSARIMALKVPVYPEPALPTFAGELPLEPRMPNRPRAPHPPQKPDWEKVQRMYGAANGTTMKRLNKKDLKKAKKHYKRAMANYERDSLSYEKLFERHQTKLANYEAALVQYTTQHQAWEAEVQNRIGAIIRFEREQYLHDYSKSLQNSIKRIGKNIHRKEYYSDLENAVENTTIRLGRMESTKELMSGYGSKTLIANLYDKHIGYKVINSPEYSRLSNKAKIACGADTSYRVADRMIKASGIVAISDSLKAEIREKQLLNAESSEQANIALRAYVADVTRLGWINCDRFYNDPVEKVQLVVNESEDATMYVVCKDISSMLPLSRNGQNTYTASGLPKGKKVSVVSIKLKNGVPHFALHDAKAGETAALRMDYRSMTMKDLREELKKLNI